MWVEANNNIVFTLWSNDGFGNGTVGVNIKGKNYRFEVDPVNFERWQRMSQWRPGKVLNDIKDHAKKRRKAKMSKPVTGPVEPKKMVQKTLSFREWMKNDTSYFLLSEDPSQKGYRRLGNIQFGPYAGQSGWWHPETKDIIPDSMVGQPDKPQIPQPQPQQQPPQQGISQQQPKKPLWTLARLKAALPDTQLLAVTQRQDGNWDAVSMPSGENYGTIPHAKIAQTIQSIKNPESKAIRSYELGDFVNDFFININNYDEEGRMILPKQSDFEVNEPFAPRKQGNTTGRDGESIVIPPEHMSEFNKAIEDRFINSNDNVMINALAGTGKTTMLKHLSAFKRPNERWLYLVFNKKNQVEASQEFPEGVDVATTHSFLGRVLRNNGADVGGKTNLPPMGAKWKKLTRMMDTLVPRDDQTFGPFRWGAVARIRKIAELAKAFAINPASPSIKQDLMGLIQKYNIDMDLSTKTRNQPRDFTPDILQRVQQLLQMSLPGQLPNSYDQQLADVRDQDDTLWLAAINADNIRWNTNPKYDVVLMDEVQDFNQCQLIMAQKLKESGARVVGVGDPNQCHPAGTLISLSGGKTKPIEEIEIGDEVVTYNTKKSYFPGTNTQGRKVEGISSRPYTGNLHEIICESGKSHKCTSNHKCLVKFHNIESAFGLYLMVKGENARVGVSRINQSNGLGPTIRARREKADKLWLLNIYDCEIKARAAEQIISANFGLPQLIFNNNGQISPSQELIDEVYKEIGNNLDKAIQCINHFGRDYNFPLWTKGKQERFGKSKKNYIGCNKSFITQACNLISKYMCVRTFENKPRSGNWEPIRLNTVHVNDTPVYSLKVQKTEDGRRLYIANNIVTHNSMYLFRGADADAFKKFSEVVTGGNLDDAMELPINFRSAPKVIEFIAQNTHVKNLQANPSLDPDSGEATTNFGYDDFMQGVVDNYGKDRALEDSTSFIARTNAPLASAAMNLLKNNVDFQILGRDLANELKKHIRKVTWNKPQKYDIADMADTLFDYLGDLNQKWGDKPSKQDELKEIEQTTEALISVLEYLQETDFREDEKSRPLQTGMDFMTFIDKKLGGLDPDNERDAKKLKERDPKSYVTLTTSHKAKGLEWDKVFVMKPDEFSPNKPNIRTQEEADQENNAWFVALSRAKKSINISADDAP